MRREMIGWTKVEQILGWKEIPDASEDAKGINAFFLGGGLIDMFNRDNIFASLSISDYLVGQKVRSLYQVNFLLYKMNEQPNISQNVDFSKFFRFLF